MFTVSRQFSVEALDVFYLENRFVFMDGMEKTMGFLNRLSPGLQQKLKMVSLSLHFTDVEDFSEVPNHVFPQILHSFIIQCLRESFGLAEVWPAIDRGPLCEDDFLFKDTSVSFKGGRRDKYNVVLEPTRQLYGPKRYYISVIL
ncbi:hypothetical protein MMC12_007243, partial [Toensbergia leucococca]|nr:hypothetical protein [Toensbergia leucococca]